MIKCGCTIKDAAYHLENCAAEELNAIIDSYPRVFDSAEGEVYHLLPSEVERAKEILQRRLERCAECGCDKINGWVPGVPCPDCELCKCGHTGFQHATAYPEWCDNCGCPGFEGTNRWTN